MFYQELQSYDKTSQQTQKKMEMGRKTLKSIQRIKGQDHKLASTCSTKERRKIQSRN